MRFVILFSLLISIGYAQQRQFEGFYVLEIRLVENKGDSLVLNGNVLIRDTITNFEFYVATDSSGFAKVLLPANRVYELTGMRDDYYDSKPVFELLNSDNRRIALQSDRMNLYYPMPFSLFNRIFFKKGSSEINPEMKVVLDSFCNAVSIAKNRILIFEVSGNTRMSKDDKGDFELSEERSIAVSDYLKLRTFNCEFIPSARSHYNLMNDCSKRNCSEKELEENDRVEILFRFTKKLK